MDGGCRDVSAWPRLSFRKDRLVLNSGLAQGNRLIT